MRRSGKLAAVLLTSAASIAATTSSAAVASATTESALPIQQIHEVNYMPSNDGWGAMWQNWDPATIASNYAQIAALGANTVRVSVPPFVFGYPTPSPTMTAEFAQIMSMAANAGLHVQLTLFDQFGNYDQIGRCEQFVNELLSPYKDDPNIAFVELQNEVDPNNTGAMTWVRTMLPYLKSVIGNIPVTISAPGGVSALQTLKTNLNGITPDLYDFHFYKNVGSAAYQFSQAKAVAGSVPLFIGEAGVNSGDQNGNTAIGESQQANFYHTVEGAAESLGLPIVSPWTMFDFTPAGLLPGMSLNNLYFGLNTTDGTPKPAAAVIHQAFTVGTEGTLENSSFENVSGGVPTGWWMANSSNATFAVDSSTAHTGVNSVSISHTSGTNYQQPAWTSLANTGTLTPGTHFQATAFAKGANATGQSVISIAWFDPNGQYLGNATSQPLTDGTSNWTELGVNSTVPQGAAYAQVNVQSYNNTGTVWFDDINLANLGTQAFPALPPVPLTSGIGPSIANSSLESVTNGTPTGWKGLHTTNGTLAVDSTTAHTGTNSVSISHTSGASNQQPAWMTVANTGQLVPGTHFQATAWAKGTNTTGTSQITIAWFNANHGYISNSGSAGLTDGTSNWTELGVNSTVPQGAAYAQVSVQSYNNTGTVWFDDINMTNLGTQAFPALPPVPLTSGIGPSIANSSLESVTNGTPTGWKGLHTTNGTLAVDSTTAHTGTNSVSISGTSGAVNAQPGWMTVANTGLLVPGTHFQATAWAKGTNATGTSQITIAWFNANHGYIANAGSASLAGGTTDWTQLSVNSTVPQGAAYAQVSVQSYNNAGTVWFDDINLTNLG